MTKLFAVAAVLTALALPAAANDRGEWTGTSIAIQPNGFQFYLGTGQLHSRPVIYEEHRHYDSRPHHHHDNGKHKGRHKHHHKHKHDHHRE